MEAEHIKRPKNAFFVWSTHERNRMHRANAELDNASISTDLGVIWGQMTEDEKAPFVEEARRLAEEHKKLYPNYKYKPKRKNAAKKTVEKAKKPPTKKTGTVEGDQNRGSRPISTESIDTPMVVGPIPTYDNNPTLPYYTQPSHHFYPGAAQSFETNQYAFQLGMAPPLDEQIVNFPGTYGPSFTQHGFHPYARPNKINQQPMPRAPLAPLPITQTPASHNVAPMSSNNVASSSGNEPIPATSASTCPPAEKSIHDISEINPTISSFGIVDFNDWLAYYKSLL